MQVTRIGPGSPADGTLQVGDVVTAVADNTVGGEESFIRLIGNCDPRTPVKLDILRGGKPVNVSVQLGIRDDAAGVDARSQRLRWRGVTFAHGTNRPGTQGVCVLYVDPTSPLAGIVKAGQLVRAVGSKPTPDLITLQQELDRLQPANLRLTLEDGAGSRSDASTASTRVNAQVDGEWLF
jgi:S1-C subfamily serine protease